MRGQVRDFDPRQNQEAKVVGDQVNVPPTRRGRPANKAVTAAQVTRRRGPGQAGDRPVPRRDQIFQVLADRSRVAQIVVLLDQAAKQSLPGGPSNLLDVGRTQASQRIT